MSISAPGFCFAFSPHLLAVVGHALASHLASATSAAPADDNANVPVWEMIAFAAALVLALALAAATGVFQPKRVDGPLRVAPRRPLWPLAAAIGIGMMVWFGSSVFYFAVKQAIHPRQTRAASTESPVSPPAGPAHDNGKPAKKPAEPTVVDFAVLSTAPGLLVFVCLYAADQQLAVTSQLQLGFTRRRFIDGVAKGLLASVMVMPAMFVAMIILELIYSRAGYKHPAEHTLLRLMNEAKSPVLRGFLIGGALVTAPFFEEYLFRGFLQTLLRQVFVGWSMMWKAGPPAPRPALPFQPGGVTAEWPALLPPSGPALPYFGPAAPTDPPPSGQRVGATWAAILITSLIFASIHETWTAPLIFLLAVFLGYAYERTGSLWTTITIHLVFNTTSTVIYLSQRS